MSIPRVIHYCWFGGAEKPPLIERCIESWRRYLPDYELLEWNESNFDPQSHPFTAEMYRRRKWAFVTDYVRLWAVHQHGGIYLDSDTELFASLDPLLDASAFIGIERMNSSVHLFCQCFGAVPGHAWLQRGLRYYDQPLSEEALFRTNTVIISDIFCQEWGAQVRDSWQRLGGPDSSDEAPSEVMVYPSWRLCMPNFWVRPYAIHHFEGSWLDRAQPLLSAHQSWPLARPWLSSWQRNANSLIPRLYYYTPPKLYPLLDAILEQRYLVPAVRALKTFLGLDPEKRFFS